MHCYPDGFQKPAQLTALTAMRFMLSHDGKSIFLTVIKQSCKPKKDIVRTYIPGDICPHNVGTMSEQCKINVGRLILKKLEKRKHPPPIHAEELNYNL